MREQAEAAKVMDDGECADDVMDDFLFDATGAASTPTGTPRRQRSSASARTA